MALIVVHAMIYFLKSSRRLFRSRIVPLVLECLEVNTVSSGEFRGDRDCTVLSLLYLEAHRGLLVGCFFQSVSYK